MKYLITGFSGFVSAYFVDFINSVDEAEILGIDIDDPDVDNSKFKNTSIEFEKVNLLDSDRIGKIFNEFRPDYILHLASFSSVAFSWKNPLLSFNNNNNIFLNLLESVRASDINCRILSIGSSEEYGIVNKGNIPIDESTPLNPISPYAVARVSQELLSKIYVSGYGLDIVMTRSFNHIGPCQKDIFAIPSFAHQMAQIKKGDGKSGLLRIGNINIVRDFLDVRDVVRAYYLLLKKGKTGEVYNVCRGKGISLKELINLMAEYLQITVDIKIEKKLLRPTDNPVIVGDNKKIKSTIRWEPQVEFKKSIADICNYWMNESF